MKLLHLIHRFPPQSLGGAEIGTYHIAQGQAEHHTVGVLYPADHLVDDSPQYPRDNLWVDVFPPPHRSRLEKWKAPLPENPDIAREFLEKVDAFGPDIITIHQLQDFPINAIEHLTEGNHRIFYRFNDFWQICARTHLSKVDLSTCEGPDKEFKNCAMCRLETGLEKWGVPGGWVPEFLALPGLRTRMRLRFRRLMNLLKKAERLICPTQFLLNKYARYGIDRKLLVHLQDPIDLAPFQNYARTPSNHFRFACLGTVGRHKGIHTAIEAFRNLNRPNTRLTIYGPFEPMHDSYHAELKAMAIPNVVFAGRFQNAAEVFKEVDCAIVPSVCFENCPAVALQARATCTPLLGANIGGIPELLSDGGGFLFQPANAHELTRCMEELLQPGTLPGLMEGNKPPYGLQEHAEKLLQIYEQSH